MPEGAVYVGRPSRWGNRFPVCPERSPAQAVAQFIGWVHVIFWTPREVSDWIAPLRGHDLVCWCPLDQPCHADVLLELANR